MRSSLLVALALSILLPSGGCQGARYRRALDECLEGEEVDQDRYASVDDDDGGWLWSDEPLEGPLVHLRRRGCLESVTVNGPNGSYTNGPFAAGSVSGFRRSPSGRRLAYSARGPRGVVTVIDGVEGAPYHGLRIPTIFSRDERHTLSVAIVYVELRRSVIVVDGEERARLHGWALEGTVGVTSAGRWIVGVPSSEEELLVYVDGRRESRCDRDRVYSNVTDLGLSTSLTGDRYAYRCRRGEREWLVLDGQETALPEGWRVGDLGDPDQGDRLRSPDIGFSDDGRRWWYHAVRSEPEPGTNENAPRSVGLVLDGELFPLGDVLAVLEVVQLRGGLWAARTEDRASSGGESLHLLGPLRCVEPAREPRGVFALVAGGQICLSEEAPVDVQLIGQGPDGAVTYRDRPLAAPSPGGGPVRR